MKKNKILFNVYILIGFVFPAIFMALPLPNIPSTQYLITDNGATTSSLNNSAAINTTISQANAAGGGTVVIPAGTFLSGPITMKSNVNLFLSSGSTLQLMPYGTGNGTVAGSYPNTGATDTYANFIYGDGLSNIEISGTGTIEGNGTDWWTAYKNNNNIVRPYLVRFKACNTVLIKDITLQNSPNVHICLGRSSSMGSNGTISNVTITAPSNSPNTDAIDTWYWDGIDILNCKLSVGDDNVAMDSYSTNINIQNCTMGDGHGVSVGSYALGVKGVTLNNTSFTNTTNGIRLKSNRTRGGDDSNFTYTNITMTGVKYPFYITSWYDKEPYPASAQVAATITANTPIWNNITFKNITVTNSTYAGIIYGLPEAYINNITFDNVNITATSSGLVTNFVNGLSFINCSSITVPSSKNAIVAYNAPSTGIDTTTGASTSCSLAVEDLNYKSVISGFPNPVKGDVFQIKSNSGIQKLEIYNAEGKLLKIQNGKNESTVSINVSSFIKGLYFTKTILTNGKSETLKFIKE